MCPINGMPPPLWVYCATSFCGFIVLFLKNGGITCPIGGSEDICKYKYNIFFEKNTSFLASQIDKQNAIALAQIWEYSFVCTCWAQDFFLKKYDRSYAKAISQMQPEQLYKQILQHDNWITSVNIVFLFLQNQCYFKC